MNVVKFIGLFLTIQLALLTGASAQVAKPELVVQKGHADPVNSVAFSPDSRIVASGSWDGTIRLWDASAGTELRTLIAAPMILSVAFSPNGNVLASGSTNQINLWDITTGKILRSLSGDFVYSVAFSPDGKTLASENSGDGTITLWDVRDGNKLHTINNPQEVWSFVVFSPDGKLLASGSQENTVTLWDVASGAEIRKLKGNSDPGKSAPVMPVTFSPDGKTLASVDPDATIRLWDVATGTEIRTIKTPSTVVWSIAFSPDNKSIAIGSEIADETGSKTSPTKLWDVTAGTEIRSLTGSSIGEMSVAFSPDGKLLAGGSRDGKVRIWDGSTGENKHVLAAYSSSVTTVAFSANSGTMITENGDMVKIWDVKTDRDPRILALHKSTLGMDRVAVSPDGKTVAIGGNDKTIRILDVASGAEIRSFQVEQQLVTYLAFSSDGEYLASISMPDLGAMMKSGAPPPTALSPKTTIEVWNTSNGKLKSIPVEGLTVTVGSGQIIALSADNKTLAVGGVGSQGFQVKILDLGTGNLLQTLTCGMSFDIAVSPDGKTLATIGLAVVNNSVAGGEVILWDIATGKPVQKFKLDSPEFGRVAFSPDSKRLVAGIGDGTLKLWDIVSGKELGTFTGHTDSVLSIAFSPDGRFLASGSRDRTTKVWEVSSGRELATLIAVGSRDWIVVTPEGQFDGSPGALNKILWRFSPDLFDVVPVEVFFNNFYYPGLFPEIFAGRYPGPPNGKELTVIDRRQPTLKVSLAQKSGSDPGKFRESTIAVKIEITAETSKPRLSTDPASSGARDLRLFRNGSLVKVWHGDVLKGQNSTTQEATIPIVAGENRLTAYAFNHDNIKSSDATLTVTGADTLKRKGIGYVLAIGVNEYANSQYNLKYAVADAQDFAEELKRQQAKLNNYERVEVISLNDKAATKINILKSLADLSAKIQPEDALIIFFAGHGTAQQNRFYLIPHDLGYDGIRTKLDRVGLENVLAHSISDEEISRAVERIDAGQMLLVIDACNSGQALEAEEKRHGPMNSKGLAQLAYEKGMYILTAAQSYQAANEAERYGHGFLTYALVEEGLKTGAADKEPKDGQVLLREWLDFATQRVPQMQQDELDKQKKQGRQLGRIKFAETDSGNDRSLQRPRVFYRRETEPNPLVVARP